MSRLPVGSYFSTRLPRWEPHSVADRAQTITVDGFHFIPIAHATETQMVARGSCFPGVILVGTANHSRIERYRYRLYSLWQYAFVLFVVHEIL
jgi:hypothetical protein